MVEMPTDRDRNLDESQPILQQEKSIENPGNGDPKKPNFVISEAYPVDKQGENRFRAKVHDFLEKNPSVKITKRKIQFCMYKPKMTFPGLSNEEFMAEIKLLHEEWFPVDYSVGYFSRIEAGIYKMIICFM